MKRKTPVTFISSLPPFKGVSAYAVPLLRALSRQPRARVEALAFKRLYKAGLYPGGSPEDSTVGRLDFSGVRTRYDLDSTNPASWLRAAINMEGRVVHAQWWSPPLAPVYVTLLAIAKLRGKKVVITVHNASSHEPSWWKSVADRVVLFLADHFIVHASENAASLARLIPRARGRTSVIPMGPEDVYERRGVTKAEARRQLGITRREKVVLFFGNIRPYKGLGLMLDAFEVLRSRLPVARLLVVGQPWAGSGDVALALQRAGKMPGVSLRLEYVPEGEVENYFVASDLAVYAYQGFEAQSGAAARALSFGRAMLVSRSGGLSDLVRDDRAIVPSGDHVALADAVEAVLTDWSLRRKLENDARIVASQLNWDDIATATVSLYEALLQGNPAGLASYPVGVASEREDNSDLKAA